MNLTKFYLFICAILVISFSVIKAQTPSDQIAALLQKIKTYDYGDSRKNLTALSDLLRSINTAEDQISQAEIQLIRFLESDATLPAKQFISEELSIYGSAKSVPVLDQMLYRLETVNMALFTLERIPGEGSIESIRNALTKTSGKTQAAVINALGNRRDKESLNMFSTLTADKDSRIASAAINALANIGTDQASVVLAELIKDKEYSLSDQAVDAYLRTADGFALVGEPEKALTIYQKLFHRDYKRAVRIAALKGIVEQSDDNGYTFIMRLFESASEEDKTLAIPFVGYIPPGTDLSSIIDLFNDLPAHAQVQLITALNAREDPAVFSLIEKSTKDPVPEVRIAAINALGINGTSESVLLLADIAASSTGSEKKEARQAIDRLNAPGVDEMIVNAINRIDDTIKLELIRSTSERLIFTAAPVLVNEIKGTNLNVRIGAIKALRIVASPDQLDQLIELHLKSNNDQERKELEKTIIAVCLRIPENESRAAYLIKQYDSLKKYETQGSYIEMLGKIGDPAALPHIQTALRNDNNILKTSAIRALSDWPDATPIMDLLSLAESSSDKKQQKLALHGYTRLIARDTSSTAVEKAAMYKKSLTLCAGVDDKQLVISELSHLETIEAARMVVKFVNDKDVHQEAKISFIQIASGLDHRYTNEILPLLKNIAPRIEDEDLKDEYDDLIKDLEKAQE